MAEPLQTRPWLSQVALKRRFVFAILIFGVLILVLLWGAVAWRLAAEREIELRDFHLRHVYLIMATIISLALIAFLAAMVYLLLHLVRYGREITRIVEHDELTGLPNRYLLMRTLQKALADDANVGRLALLYIDLDNFKGINDTLGHDVGDDVLCRVSRRFAGVLAPGHMLARLRGDEFVVVARGGNVRHDAIRIAGRLSEALQKPFEVSDNAFRLHASIGIAFYSEHHENENDLLKKADLAMYSAKDNGKSSFKVFTREMSYRASQLITWERQIGTALVRGEFFMSYQPIMHLGPDGIAGFEALIRWRHPEQGVIAAGEFIPIAETTGQIVQIGELALTSACRQLAVWQTQLAVPLRLSVNVSSVQFWRTDMYDVVRRCLNDYGVSPQWLELEMTESVMVRNPAEVEAAIEQLKALGVRIALDDFGTGYSSLAYLSRFSVDTLKLDGAFMADVPKSRKACLMVSNIVNIARALGAELVIEGVENHAQLDWLRQFATLRVQGFVFSPPVDAEQVPDLLARFGSSSEAP